MKTKEIIENLKADIKVIDGKEYIEQSKIDNVLIALNLPAWKLDEIIDALEKLDVKIVEDVSQIKSKEMINNAIIELKLLANSFKEKYNTINTDELDDAQLIELNQVLCLFPTNIKKKTNTTILKKTTIRKSITIEMIKYCYIYGEKYYNSDMSIVNAREKVSEITEMNEASAHMYIDAVKHMLDGTGTYKKAISSAAYEFFFDTIFEKYGQQRLLQAIKVAENHLDYLENISGSFQNKARLICKKFSLRVL